jgi:hypothetical protein
MRVLLAAGEEVVAYGILRDNHYEIDLRPPADLGRELRRAVIEAGADPARADLLPALTTAHRHDRVATGSTRRSVAACPRTRCTSPSRAQWRGVTLAGRL